MEFIKKSLIKLNDWLNEEPFSLKRIVAIMSGLYFCSSLALAASGNNLLGIRHFCIAALGGALFCLLKAFDLFCDYLKRTS